MRSLLPLVTVATYLLLPFMMSTTASAWSVSNLTSRSYDGVVRLSGGAPILVFSVGANGQYGCDWTLANCNPLQPMEPDRDLVVSLTDSDGRTFECQVRMKADGKVKIWAHTRDLTAPSFPPVSPNFYCASTYGGARVDGSDPFADVLDANDVPEMTAANRSVKFLATGDPQYDNSNIDDDGNTSGKALDADAMLIALTELLETDDDYRGVIVNGDLTQNARGDNDGTPFQSSDELDAYHWAIGPESRMFFEGLGNHDVEDTGASSAPADVREYIHEKPRNTIRTFSGTTNTSTDPHYSWDWHDVHFVQLNMMPADDPSDEFGDLDPRDALSWLASDLALMVADTGRPVVLNHHYGFDGFSTGVYGIDSNGPQEWWTGPQRAAYWNVISDYNVIAIFTGHLHLNDDDEAPDWFHEFEQPTLATSAPIFPLSRPDGRNCIPTFIGGAVLNGAALEVLIDDSQVKIDRRGETGIVADNTVHYDLNLMETLPGSGETFECPEPGAAASMVSGLVLLYGLARRRCHPRPIAAGHRG